MQAGRLLNPEVADVDAMVESREGTVSIFNGQEPDVRVLPDEAQEMQVVSRWLRARLDEGVLSKEIGIIVRSEEQPPRAQAAAATAELPTAPLNPRGVPVGDHASICTMHLAKGLEFRAVVVMACDDEVLPLQSRIESVSEHSELEEVYCTERHLLYVACTRARDQMVVTSAAPGSEFLDDLLS